MFLPSGLPIMSRRFQGGTPGTFHHIPAHGVAGDQWDMALQILSTMPARRVRINIVTLNAALSAWAPRAPRAPIQTSPKQHAVKAAMALGFTGFMCLHVSSNRPISSEACGDRWQVALVLFDEAKVQS